MGERDTGELDLFHARTTDPQTSHDRMATLGDEHPDRWEKIAVAIRTNGPLTYREAMEITGIDGMVTSTDMTKMEQAGILTRIVTDAGDELRRNGATVRALKGDPRVLEQYPRTRSWAPKAPKSNVPSALALKTASGLDAVVEKYERVLSMQDAALLISAARQLRKEGA